MDNFPMPGGYAKNVIPRRIFASINSSLSLFNNIAQFQLTKRIHISKSLSISLKPCTQWLYYIIHDILNKQIIFKLHIKMFYKTYFIQIIMISQQYQKYCQNSFKEVQNLKFNVNIIHKKASLSNDPHLKTVSNQLNQKVHELDGNLNQRIGQIYTKIISNFNSAVQPLPQIQQQGQERPNSNKKLRLSKRLSQSKIKKQVAIKRSNTSQKLPKLTKAEEILGSFSVSKSKIKPYQQKLKCSRMISTQMEATSLTKINKNSISKFSSKGQLTTTKKIVQEALKATDQIIKQQSEQVGFKSSKRLCSQQAKRYQQVVDSYSLHLIIIRKGQVLDETPQFASFNRTYHKHWKTIQILIKRLQKLVGDAKINTVTVNGKQLAFLARNVSNPTDSDILQCITNLHQLIHRFKNIKFKVSSSKNIAATKIQTIYRGFIARRYYKKIQYLVKKVKIIQRAFRLFLQFKKGKENRSKRSQMQYQQFKNLRQKMMQNWVKKQRVQIHIVGFSGAQIMRLTTQKVQQKMNLQINRIFNIADPLCQIVYVCPFDLPLDIINYYYKVLEIGDIIDAKNRLHFVSPENGNRFPSHYSPVQCLLYSPKILTRIKKLIKNKYAYIVPSYPCSDNIKLASELNIPLMSGDPQNHMYISSKSGSKRLFNQLQIPTGPSSLDIYDQSQLINSLVFLIFQNPDVQCWALKIDDQISGRGIGWFFSNKVRSIRQIKQRQYIQGESQQIIVKMTEIIREKLPKKLKYNYNQLYKNYRQFIRAFLVRGGIVQAVPNCAQCLIQSASVSFNIQPNGKLNIISTYDKININNSISIGCVGPSQVLDPMAVIESVKTLSKNLYNKKSMFGYFSLDFIVFPHPNNKDQRLAWAIGLDCYLNHYAASAFYAFFVTKSRFYLQQNLILSNNSRKKKGQTQQSQDSVLSKKLSLSQNKSTPDQITYIYCPMIIHQGLCSIQYKSFFHLCRLENISFDLKRKIGIVFLMIDSLQSGAIGMMSICDNLQGCLRYMNNSFEFLQRKLGHVQRMGIMNDESRTDKIHFTQISNCFRLQLKGFEKHKKEGFKGNLTFIS